MRSNKTAKLDVVAWKATTHETPFIDVSLRRKQGNPFGSEKARGTGKLHLRYRTVVSSGDAIPVVSCKAESNE